MKQSKYLSILATTFIVIGVVSVFVAPALSAEGLTNPLGANFTDPRLLAGRIIKAMLGLVGSIALLVFIYGGFMWVMSAGNDEKVKKGKDAILWASLGIAIIFLSYAVVTFVIKAVAPGSGGATPTPGGATPTTYYSQKIEQSV
jgi:hypothetical protein